MKNHIKNPMIFHGYFFFLAHPGFVKKRTIPTTFSQGKFQKRGISSGFATLPEAKAP